MPDSVSAAHCALASLLCAAVLASARASRVSSIFRWPGHPTGLLCVDTQNSPVASTHDNPVESESPILAPRSNLLGCGEVTVLVSSSVEEIQEHVHALMLTAPTCLGLDAEWRPASLSKVEEAGQSAKTDAALEEDAAAERVAVLQLASDQVVLVIQILRATEGGTKDIPRSLRELLAAPHIVKLGVGIHDDAERLTRSYPGLECRSCIDLRALALERLPSAIGGNCGLKSLGAEVGLTLDKAASVRMSDWSRHQLTPEQIKYAAEDALVALLIYDHLVQLGDVNIEAWSLHWTYPDGSGGGGSNRTHPWHHVAHLVDVRWCGRRGRLRSGAGGQSGKKTDTAKARDAEHRLKDPGRLKARKTLLYDNCKLLDPSGRQLCNLKRDRVDWYLARGLAELEHAPECRAGPGGCSCLQRTDLVIRLKFEPRGRGHEGNEYYLAPKSNVCVVCGAAAGLMRYAVVPQMYRRHLPEQLKSRSSHDIVLLCIKCHQLASVRANELRDALSRECNAPLHPAPQPLDPLRKSARSMAAALLSARAGGIPPARRATMLETVSRFLRQQPFIPASVGGVEARVAIVSGPENISDQVLRWVSSLPAHEGAGPREGGAGERGEACECDDKAALSHGAIVVAAQEDLASFIRRCRKHFLSSMDPAHLPTGWSVDNPLFYPLPTECGEAYDHTP